MEWYRKYKYNSNKKERIVKCERCGTEMQAGLNFNANIFLFMCAYTHIL
jgi:transposase